MLASWLRTLANWIDPPETEVHVIGYHLVSETDVPIMGGLPLSTGDPEPGGIRPPYPPRYER